MVVGGNSKLAHCLGQQPNLSKVNLIMRMEIKEVKHFKLLLFKFKLPLYFCHLEQSKASLSRHFHC